MRYSIMLYSYYNIISLCFLFPLGYHLQSNEVSSSNHMEKEGLHQVLEFLKEKDLKVGILVTDWHQKIK